MTTTQTTETPERIFRLRTSLAEIAASQSDALGMRAVARAALAEDEALAASPGAVDAVRALEFVERIRRFAADADASDAVSAATALTYVERNAEALAALLAASTSDTALRAAAARLVACLDAITFSEGPEYAAADAPDRFRVIQIRPLETWRQSVRNLADLRALLASSPAPVLEPEHAGTLLGAPCPNCGSKLDTYCPDCAWPRPEPGFVSPAPEDPPAPATTTPEEPDLAQAAAEGYEAGVRDALRGDAPAELIAALSAAPAPDAHTETPAEQEERHRRELHEIHEQEAADAPEDRQEAGPGAATTSYCPKNADHKHRDSGGMFFFSCRDCGWTDDDASVPST